MNVFIQVIQGKCSRQDELRSLAEAWRDEGGVGAVGWLGGTYGVTDDDDFFGVVRFTSRDDAMANSARPEGFVQVISGHLDDPAAAKAMLADTGELREMRPEIIGGTFAIADDGTYFQTVYFTDEESARKGEQTEPPEEVRAELESMMAGATFYDLHKPWFASP